MNTIPDELIARYLAGECNEEEKEQVREWGRKHPDMMEEYRQIWQQFPPEDFAPDVEHALRKVNLHIDTKKKSASKRLYILTGAVAAAILLVVSFIGIRHLNRQAEMGQPVLLALETGTNKTTQYRLPDGSTVWLNQSSTIRYPEQFADNTREIYLEGEAFFDISPDRDKPFIIHAGQTTTRVVGTSFGIRAIKETDEVIVTVSTGIVNLSPDGEARHIELREGEQGVCLPKVHKLEKNTQPDPNALAWKTKILVFRQTPLSEVASVIQNTYHVPIQVDDSIAQLKLNSTFEQEELEDIIRIIEMSLQIHARDHEGGFLLSPATE